MKHEQINIERLFTKCATQHTEGLCAGGRPSLLALSMIGPHSTWLNSQFLLAEPDWCDGQMSLSDEQT
jgi:hypothetical protein